MDRTAGVICKDIAIIYGRYIMILSLCAGDQGGES